MKQVPTTVVAWHIRNACGSLYLLKHSEPLCCAQAVAQR